MALLECDVCDRYKAMTHHTWKKCQNLNEVMPPELTHIAPLTPRKRHTNSADKMNKFQVIRQPPRQKITLDIMSK